MNEISQQMDAKKIIVLGVNYELIDKVQTVRKGLDIHFSSIFADTLLSKSFPHRGIPHMVWIKDGKVIGIPEHQYVDLAAVKLAVESGLVNIPEKRNDRMLDPQRKLFSEGNGISPIIYQADGLQIYASNAEYIYEPIKRIETQDSIVFYGNNIAIPRLIHSLYKDDLFVPFKRYPSNFMELENGLTSSLLRNKEAVGIKASYAKGDYNEDNEARWLRSIVESYFLQHHNLETKVAHATKERYAVLKRKEPLDAVRSTMQSTSSKAGVFQDSGHKVYTSLPFGVHFINVLEARLAKIPGLDLTVLELVDRSGMDKLLLVDFEMPIAIDGLHELNKGIAKYGLQVEIEEGWADKVFVNYGKGGKND
ncbi:hypothetical protein GCM10011418_47010 [Sphingobacterium alkalisoli]|nr:hypothetical protein GCM10011418_47010 [Sphingobacterium alkalisoli]